MAFVAPASLRGFFGGSGKGLVGSEAAARRIIGLSGKASPSVLYVGTPTYDLAVSRDQQCAGLVQLGCPVKELKVAHETPGQAEIKSLIEDADVIVVSGGNTLWAVDRWKNLGIPPLFAQAMDRGVVLAGGSAGAICWFDGGHSDSMDPHTYFATPFLFTGESGDNAGDRTSWDYIRVPGLSFLPGLICPHHDRRQSNGILRSEDFNGMLQRHPGEQGICIDHFAALVVEGDRYEVFHIDEPGSVKEDGSFSSSGEGRPGVWVKNFSSEGVQLGPALDKGSLSELLKRPSEVKEDPRLEVGRRENPQPSAEAEK